MRRCVALGWLLLSACQAAPPGVDAALLDGGLPPVDAGPVDAGADAGRLDVDAWIPPGCVPNEDGTIEASELLEPIGPISVLVALSPTIDLHGSEWDLTGPFAGESESLLLRRAIDGQWFSTHFPGASFTLPISQTQDLLGVFELTDDDLLLLGVVSSVSGATELVYDPPAEVLHIPLVSDASWSTTSAVSGTLDGASAAYTEQRDVSVVRGAIDLSVGRFDALRVRTGVTRSSGASLVTSHFMFVSECRGIVAEVDANEGDASSEPSQVQALWRLAP